MVKGVALHEPNPVLEAEYKDQAVRAIPRHTLNTWMLIQMRQEFIFHEAQRAAHLAAKREEAVLTRKMPMPRARLSKQHKQKVQTFGSFEGCVASGRWSNP